MWVLPEGSEGSSVGSGFAQSLLWAADLQSGGDSRNVSFSGPHSTGRRRREATTALAPDRLQHALLSSDLLCSWTFGLCQQFEGAACLLPFLNKR